MILPAEHYMSWAMMSARSSYRHEPRTSATRYSFFQARNAIYHSLTLLGIEPGSEVLVPSYICRAAVDPLLAYGLNVRFYAVKQDCSLDLDDIKAKITPRTQAVMVVHYFGFPQPTLALRRLCDFQGLALIEDCAHVLTG